MAMTSPFEQASASCSVRAVTKTRRAEARRSRPMSSETGVFCGLPFSSLAKNQASTSTINSGPVLYTKAGLLRRLDMCCIVSDVTAIYVVHALCKTTITYNGQSWIVNARNNKPLERQFNPSCRNLFINVATHRKASKGRCLKNSHAGTSCNATIP